MGNFSSCFKVEPTTKSNVATLVDSQGQTRLIELPTTVVEIMLENPGFALSPVDNLQQTRRIPVMKADDMLLGRKVYLLVPVDKVNSRLSDLQLAAIDSLVSSCSKRTRGSSKVSPIVMKSEDLKEVTGLAGQKNGLGKPWEPVLEPILEVV